MGKEAFNELSTACDEAIEFRKSHFSDYKEEISDLLQVVREFVVKPDYMNELLVALTNFLNKASDREIDVDVVNKLSDIIPLMKEIGNKEVAKTIIEEFHNDNTDKDSKEEKPKAKRGRKPKAENLEVVK